MSTSFSACFKNLLPAFSEKYIFENTILSKVPPNMSISCFSCVLQECTPSPVGNTLLQNDSQQRAFKNVDFIFHVFFKNVLLAPSVGSTFWKNDSKWSAFNNVDFALFHVFQKCASPPSVGSLILKVAGKRYFQKMHFRHPNSSEKLPYWECLWHIEICKNRKKNVYFCFAAPVGKLSFAFCALSPTFWKFFQIFV